MGYAAIVQADDSRRKSHRRLLACRPAGGAGEVPAAAAAVEDHPTTDTALPRPATRFGGAVPNRRRERDRRHPRADSLRGRRRTHISSLFQLKGDPERPRDRDRHAPTELTTSETQRSATSTSPPPGTTTIRNRPSGCRTRSMSSAGTASS